MSGRDSLREAALVAAAVVAGFATFKLIQTRLSSVRDESSQGGGAFRAEESNGTLNAVDDYDFVGRK